MEKTLKRISLETEEIAFLSAPEMLSARGGNAEASSAICAWGLESSVGCVTAIIGAATAIITAIQGCDHEEQEDTTSEILIDSKYCELEPAYAYSYA